MINLSEAEKTQFRVSFIGQLSKQGHGVKSWKDRIVHIVDSRMYYFDTSGTNKGIICMGRKEGLLVWVVGR